MMSSEIFKSMNNLRVIIVINKVRILMKNLDTVDLGELVRRNSLTFERLQKKKLETVQIASAQENNLRLRNQKLMEKTKMKKVVKF